MFDVDKLNIYWNGDSKLFNIKSDPDFNRLLQLEQKILLHPRNAHMLFMPVIDDLLKQDARAEIIGRLKKLPLKDPTTFFQTLTPQKNVEKGLTFVKSKFGVGVVALDITGHAVFMVDDINISPTFNNPNNEFNSTPTGLLFEGLQNKYSLTSMYDAAGRIISEVQSQTMNSQVDAGKDPYAVGLGINSQTLNMLMYLNRRGVPIITALKFINQPMIQDYLELQRINESLVNKQRGEELRKSELIDSLYAKHELNRPLLDRRLTITEKSLDSGILKGEIDVMQSQYFEYFLALVDEVSAFNDLKNVMTVDTKGKKDRAAVENYQKLMVKVIATGIVSDESLHKIVNKGLLSPFYTAQQLYTQLYYPFYAFDTSLFGEPLRALKDMLADRQKGEYMKDKVRTTVENDFMLFLIQNYHDDFSLDSFDKIFGFTDDLSIAKQIQDLQNNKALKDNPVIQALFPMLSVAKDKASNKMFDALKLFEREISTLDLNDFIDYMKDIRDEVDENLYKSIIQLGIYQAGFLNSPFSLNKVFPTFNTSKRENGKLVEFTNDYLREIQLSVVNKLRVLETESDLIFDQFNTLFYLNNPDFLPKRFWKKSPIKFFYLWSKDRQERVLRYIDGPTNVEMQPLGNTYFKRYFLELAPNIDLTPTADTTSSTSGFKGYKGGYSNDGKGTPQGDGKDKAMREVAKFFIGEMTDGNTESSTFGSLMAIKKDPLAVVIRSDKGGTYNIYDAQDGKIDANKYVSINNVLEDLRSKKGVVMLAKNGSAPKQLLQYTKDLILEFHNNGAEFIVGDMPGVDSQFIDYLKEIGATFTIYHAGSKSRITVDEGQKTIKMQLDNIEKIKSNNKTITNRTEKFDDGIYTLVDNTRVELKYMGEAKVGIAYDARNKEIPVVNIKISNFETHEWNGDQFAQAEGFKDWNDFKQNNKFSDNFINGKQSRYVYDIKVLQQNDPNQLDLFSGLSEPMSSMEDNMFTPEEIAEAQQKKQECKGTNPKPITK